MKKTLLTIVLIIAAIGLIVAFYLIYPRNSRVQVKDFQYGSYTFKHFDNGPEGAAARLSDKLVTTQDLHSQSNLFNEIPVDQTQNPVILSALQTRAFYTQIELLNEMMNQHMILTEARKNNMSYGDFVKTYITKGDVYVSDREIQNFITESGINNKKTDKLLKKQIESILKDKKTKEKISAYTKNTFGNHFIEYYFNPPQHNFSIPAGLAFAQKDPKDKRESIYIFSNLNCGPCKIFANNLLKLYQEHSQNIHFIFINSFQENDWVAQMLAEASTCLGYQNEKYFWDFLRLSADTSSAFNEESINLLAKTTGADFDRYQQCMLNHEATAKVKRHLSVSKSMGVTTQPTIFVGTMVFTPSFKYEQIHSALKQLTVE